MAVASNPLLQIGTSVTGTGKTQATPVSSLSKTADATKDGGSSFAEVYAQEHKGLPQKSAAAAVSRPSAHLAASDKKPAAASQAKDDKPAVAANGKSSPVNKPDRPDKASKADKQDQAAKADDGDDDVQAADASDVDDLALARAKAQDDDQAASDDESATAALPTPEVDPTAATPPPSTALTTDPSQLAQPVIDPAAMQASTQAAVPAVSANETDFDPTADALADLPMVRMALEQRAKDQGTTSVHAQAENQPTSLPSDPNSNPADFAQTMGAMLDTQQPGDASVSDDKGDGLAAIGEVKDGNGTATTDNRVDDLNGRLNQLNQAVGGKATNTATPLAQPLNMQQNGWSEGLVNRVMYLSSQNLKSADIQLHPLELGRLDIRVDVTPDQQTQITFHSAHLGVRDALESQQGRLRDMLSQQGLTQVDVNVSDQSRQFQQQQQQQQQAQAGQAMGGSQARDGGAADEAQVSAVAEATATQTVIGSSLVDYYA